MLAVTRSSQTRGGPVENRIGADIVKALLENLEGKEVDYVYIDEDEGGRYLGVAFTDGETECHLTFQQDGFIQLAAGPEEGAELNEVLSFDLATVEEPFSEDGAEGA
jgi:hypothetical protein